MNVRKEALLILFTIIELCTIDNVVEKMLTDNDCRLIEIFLQQDKVQDVDILVELPKMCQRILELGLLKQFETLGGIEVLLSLETSPYQQVYQNAAEVLDAYRLALDLKLDDGVVNEEAETASSEKPR